MSDMTTHASRNRNRGLAAGLAIVVLLMVGAAYAAVPLYSLFCQVTGFGGTTQVSAGNPKGLLARLMTVRFDANVEASLPWSVVAAKPVTDGIGMVETVNFTARNLSEKAVTGQAVFNVTPDQAGIYFNKIECFCFTEQTLEPGQSIAMPVTFFVDPDIDQNPDLDTIREITLSYTFYAIESEGS